VVGVEVNGIAAISNDGFANWWAELPLTLGSNSVELKVTDSVGNQFVDEKALNIERNVFWTGPADIALDTENNRVLVTSFRGTEGLIAVDTKINPNVNPETASNDRVVISR
jgi:hypothetical protein